MTEAEWLASADTKEMVWALRGLTDLRRKGGARKLRLFAAACCRRVWHLLDDEAGRRAVEVAERFADGQATAAELRAASAAAARAAQGGTGRVPDAFYAARRAADTSPTYTFRPGYTDGPDANAAAAVERATLWRLIVGDADPQHAAGWAAARMAKADEQRCQADVLRCVFGNPFHPAAFDPAWRTDAAVSLARGMYESRDFSAMPILADALQDAGCEDGQVLGHCRGDGPHARGCFVVDALLKKG